MGKEKTMSDKTAIYVNLSKEKVGVCATYLQSLLDIMKNKTIILQHLSIDALEAEVNLLVKAIVALKGFGQTERLQLADKKRDKRLSAIGLLIRAFASNEDENQEDAKDLLIVLNSYGVSKVRSSSYSDETAKIKSMIERFNTSPNIEKVAKFQSLSDWLTFLEDDNSAFEVIMNEKASEMNMNYESCGAICDRIIPLYRNFIKGINAHAFIETDPEFDAFIDEHNAQVVVQHLD